MVVDPELIARMERSEAERLYDCAVSAGLEVIRIAGGVACYGGQGHVATQCAAIGLERESEEGEFEAVIDLYRDRCDAFEFKLAPTVGMGWRELVVQSAVHVPDFESQLVLDLKSFEAKPSGDVDIRKVNPDRIETYGRESTRRFCPDVAPSGLAEFISASVRTPGAQAFEVFEDDIAVASCALAVVDGVAWLSGAAVDPPCRGRGLHKAMQAFRLYLAKEKGCDIACQGALAGSISQQNAQKSGFQIAYTRPTFLVSPTSRRS